ncbi:sugar ABC transporter permease, partial [Gardnerella vaginalis]
MKMSIQSKVVVYALLVMVAIYFFAPFGYMLFSTLKTSSEAIAYPPTLFPKEWHWDNYVTAWNSQPFGTFFMNSMIVTVFTTIGQILSCSLVAYGFARYNFRGKNVLFIILLSTMMIPWDVTMIPQYMEFKAFGWINTLLPLIVPAFFGSAYYIFLLRQFLLGVPKEYEEAARIDGCNDLQIWWKVYMPIMRPCL